MKSILNSESNILKFQERFKIIDSEENAKDFLSFVFGESLSNVDYKKLKEETNLQKQIKTMLLNNEKLHIGVGVLK